METIRLLVVDDHALFRRALANLLGNEPGFEVVGEAGDGAEAVRKAQALRPDLILMDIHMPGTDGLEATRQIVSALPATRVVILTVSEEDKDLFEAIKSGAHGYLLKTVEPEGLCALLRGVFRGEAPLSRATAAKILKQFAKREANAPATVGGGGPHGKGKGRPRAPGFRPHEQGDREQAGDRGEHREEPSQEHPRQAPSGQSRAGGGAGDTARPRPGQEA